MTKLRNKIIVIATLSAIGLSACAKPVVEDKTPAESITSIPDFKYSQEHSKAYIVFDGDTNSKTEISKYVTNYSSGDLFINELGLEKIFGLKETAPTEEEISYFNEEEKAEGLASDPNGEFLKFSNENRNFIFKEGSKMYLADGSSRMMSSIVMKLDDGHYSISLMNIIFDFGYDAVGTSVEGDAIIYSLNSSNPADKSSINFVGSAVESQSSEESAPEESIPEGETLPLESASNEEAVDEIMTKTASIAEEIETTAVAETMETITEAVPQVETQIQETEPTVEETTQGLNTAAGELNTGIQ